MLREENTLLRINSLGWLVMWDEGGMNTGFRNLFFVTTVMPWSGSVEGSFLDSWQVLRLQITLTLLMTVFGTLWSSSFFFHSRFSLTGLGTPDYKLFIVECDSRSYKYCWGFQLEPDITVTHRALAPLTVDFLLSPSCFLGFNRSKALNGVEDFIILSI